MLSLVQPLTLRTLTAVASRKVASRRFIHSASSTSSRFGAAKLAAGCSLVVSAVLALGTAIHLDAAEHQPTDETGASSRRVHHDL